MVIPWQQLSDDALRSIIEQVVLREGTDYGELEISFDDKINQIYAQLKNNKLAIVYSELHDSVDIKTLPLRNE